MGGASPQRLQHAGATKIKNQLSVITKEFTSTYKLVYSCCYNGRRLVQLASYRRCKQILFYFILFHVDHLNFLVGHRKRAVDRVTVAHSPRLSTHLLLPDPGAVKSKSKHPNPEFISKLTILNHFITFPTRCPAQVTRIIHQFCALIACKWTPKPGSHRMKPPRICARIVYSNSTTTHILPPLLHLPRPSRQLPYHSPLAGFIALVVNPGVDPLGWIP